MGHVLHVDRIHLDYPVTDQKPRRLGHAALLDLSDNMAFVVLGAEQVKSVPFFVSLERTQPRLYARHFIFTYF